MKHIAVWIALIGWASLAQDAGELERREPGAGGGAYRLWISSEKSVFKIGEPVTIKSVLANVSQSAGRYSRVSAESFYQMDVFLPYPKWIPFSPTAPLTEIGHRRKYPRGGGAISRRLNPGEEVADSFELSALYVMSIPGEYRIVFSCRVPHDTIKDKFIAIRSNEVRLRLVEATGKAE